MQKGMMITGIVDGVVQIGQSFTRVSKKVKEEGLITEKESIYITGVFNEMLKTGNQSIEKVKELLSPKHTLNEQDKIQLLEQLYQAVKADTHRAIHFEKGFARLSQERSRRLSSTDEIERLFQNREAPKTKKAG
jgi:hypothetical protein